LTHACIWSIRLRRDSLVLSDRLVCTRHLYCVAAGTAVCNYFLRLTFARVLTERHRAAPLRQQQGARGGGAAPPRAQGCRQSSQHGDDAQELITPNTSASALVCVCVCVCVCAITCFTSVTGSYVLISTKY